MRTLLITIFIFIISFFSLSAQAFSVSTFHCISLYWSPANGASTKVVQVQFSESGLNNWQNGLDMIYNPIAGSGNNPKTGLRYDKADYRGSIVDLTPGLTYDIILTLEGTATKDTIQATTWKEEFPIGATITPGNFNSQYTISQTGGTPTAYLLIDGTGDTIDIQDGSENAMRLIEMEYVIIRGYTILGATIGIRIVNSHHVVIEDCDISQWGTEDIAGTGFGVNYQSGIYAGSDHVHHCVIQRNKIHHPKWDTNSWAELHDPASDPANNNNYHPAGPQGVSLGQCNIGNNVIRYNEFWSDSTHYFNDVLGMWSNASYSGFPGADSDIYGNYIANCFDDGIESEGCNTNVRIWGNYIEEVFEPMANAATSIGPLYVWKNVSGRCYSHPGSVHGEYASFMKMGFANNISWMTGHMYLFNNTILQPNDHGSGGLGTYNASNRYIKHCVTRNNILHVRTATTNSISTVASNEDFDYDYDLHNKPIPAGEEVNGFVGIPTYEAGSPYFDFTSKSGVFQLAPTSLGYDGGEIIPNFSHSFLGASPDVGAHEHGSDTLKYGITALHPLPARTSGWIGTISTDWNNPGNWGGSLLPNNVSDVIIPVSAPFQPTVNINTTIRSITLENNAEINIQMGKIFTVLQAP